MQSIKVDEASKKCDLRPYRFTLWDTLLLTLHVSRIFGVAPLSFKKDQSGCLLGVSFLATVYGSTLISMLHIGVLAGLAIDLQEDPAHSMRVGTPSRRLAFIGEVVLVMTIVSIGAYNAPRRMKDILQYLEVVDKVNATIGGDLHQRSRKTHFFGTIVLIISASSLLCSDFLAYYLDIKCGKGSLLTLGLYSCFFVELFIMILLELQFMWLATLVTSSLETVNNGLEKLVQITLLQREPSTIAVNRLGIGSFHQSVPVRKLNALIDTLSFANVRNSGRQTSPEVLECVRQLMVSYGTLCDVVTDINNTFGSLLLLFIASFTMHFVISPFYLIGYLDSQKKVTLSLINQMCFMVYHSLYMLMVVEPGYYTSKQVERTQILVRQLMQAAPSPLDPLGDELDLFCKQVDLNQPAYTPLGMCTITRPLITIIIGGATTYLVIILQFQQMDTRKLV